MAISSMYSFLMKSTDGTSYTKLVDIKDLREYIAKKIEF